MDEKSGNPTNESIITARSYPDKATHDKITRHLSDINDVITEEDIRNVKTDIGAGDLVDEEEGKDSELLEDYAEKELTEKEKIDEFKESRKINSSWNLLDE